MALFPSPTDPMRNVSVSSSNNPGRTINAMTRRAVRLEVIRYGFDLPRSPISRAATSPINDIDLI
jgi:hypothetical protein